MGVLYYFVKGERQMDEDQTMELEALEAIYMDEFTLVSDTVPRKFTINIAPEGDIDEETTTLSLQMKVKLPETYPEVAPLIKLKPIRGVTDSECTELRQQLLDLAEDNLGTQMIFTLASHIQEWMIEIQQQEEEKKLNPSKEEIEITKKRQGNLLTVENFLEWKKKFDAEMAEKENSEKVVNLGKTGKQLFQEDETLYQRDEDLDDDENFVEDASLFMDEDIDFE